MIISPEASLTVTVGLAGAAVVALIGATWRVANVLRDIRDEMKEIHGKVDAVAQDNWTVRDMERFVAQMKWENRDKNVMVPDPVEIRLERARQSAVED